VDLVYLVCLVVAPDTSNNYRNEIDQTDRIYMTDWRTA
jgi:hypothetical protein